MTARKLFASIAAVVLLLPNMPADAQHTAEGDMVREYVDDVTAVSVTVASDPLVFARERRDLAVNARDYLTLAPLEINRTGRRSYFWFAYLWSTIDRRGQPLLGPEEKLVLIADGRPIVLESDGKPVREHGLAQLPISAPVRTATPLLFSATLETLGYVAAADDVSVKQIQEGGSESFVLWKGSPQRLQDFVRRLEAPQ